MKHPRLILTLLVGATVALACGRLRPKPVETDLWGLVDLPGDSPLRVVAETLAARGRVLVSGPAGTDLSPVADRVAAALLQPTNVPFAATLRFLEAHRAGLLADATRVRLRSGRTDEVAAAALAQLYGPVPALVSPARDPFGLVTAFVQDFQTQLAPGWTLRGGRPVREAEGRVHCLVPVDLTALDAPAIEAFRRRAAAFNAGGTDFGTRGGTIRIACSGPPFHSSRSSTRAQAEINLLSALSLFVVLFLGWRLFGSLRFVPGLLTALGIAALTATAALFACFPRPHVLSFVFGTSLIGLTVDYFYHARVSGGARTVRRPMTLSLVTTVAAFAPLAFAAVPVLRQMAVFTSAGLVTAWLWMLTERNPPPAVCIRDARAPRTSSAAGLRVLALLVLAVAAAGVGRVSVSSDPAAFYRPEPDLAADERLCCALDAATTVRYVFVRGATLQEALEREERAGLKGLSACLPSLKRQRENAALIARLYAAEGRAFAAQTGLPVTSVPPPAEFLDPERIGEPRLRALVSLFRVRGGLVAPCPDGFVPANPTCTVLEPRAAMNELFAALTTETRRLFYGSLSILVLLLAVLFRRQLVAHVLPVGAMLMATAGTLGWLGVPVTFFTLLCFFVLTGLAFDYVIFFRSRPDPRTRRTVLFSFLTSLVGLGALAFTGFAVTRAMGVTFAFGLAYAWLFARAAAGDGMQSADDAQDAPWYRQREQGAGTVRLALLWIVYRFFGKDVLKIVCVPVVACLAPFARSARRALRRFDAVAAADAHRRPASGFSRFCRLVEFAWALVDKTDLFTLAKDPPRVTVRNGADAQAFLDTVAAGRGAFLLASHLGTAEMLAALPVSDGRRPHVHAFQQMGHDALFMKMLLSHFRTDAVTLHPTESVGVETAVEMQAALAHGELVLMAGDRTSAGSDKIVTQTFLGRPCAWPKGVFVFAKLMEAPVFFFTCIRTGWNAYEVRFKAFAGSSDAAAIRTEYVTFLESETRAHPEAWHHFHDFFVERQLCHP